MVSASDVSRENKRRSQRAQVTSAERTSDVSRENKWRSQTAQVTSAESTRHVHRGRNDVHIERLWCQKEQIKTIENTSAVNKFAGDEFWERKCRHKQVQVTSIVKTSSVKRKRTCRERWGWNCVIQRARVKQTVHSTRRCKTYTPGNTPTRT